MGFFSRIAATLGLLTVLTLPTLAQTDYTLDGSGFPLTTIAGNPVLQLGDRLVGTVGDVSNDYGEANFRTGFATFAGTGTPGLYRYRFTLENNGSDGVLSLFDTNLFNTSTGEPFLLGFSDDPLDPDAVESITFDLFDTGADQIFGFGINPYNENTETSDVSGFDFSITWERTEIPVTDLGLINNLSLLDLTTPGAGSWYSFLVTEPTLLTVDTLGSFLDTEIALFSASGETLLANDDVSSLNNQSLIQATLAPGTYYVAVGEFNSRYNYDTIFGGNLGWSRNGFSGTTGLDGPFVLNFSVAPEPGTFGLLTFAGVAGLVARRKRK